MWKFLFKTLIVLGILGGLGYLIWQPTSRYLAERSKPRWRTVAVDRGDITEVVNATGTVKPVKSVQVGSFVSGPIKDLYVEFNQEVKAGEIMARVDPRLFEAAVALDRARLQTSKAEVRRVEAVLQQAKNDEARAMRLKERDTGFIAQAELDQVKFNRMSLEAQLEIAKASIMQAEASLRQSQANLDFTEIKASEDGLIIDRKVNPGQTLAAQFQTPEMFTLGVGMREKVHVFADVDESEIGMVRRAADQKQPVTFTVSAYPDDLFTGSIEEVRYSSATNQNVVTYPVVVGAPNPDLKLLPGMTANLSFQIDKVEQVLRLPQAALRFYPPKPEYVHPDDRAILEGAAQLNNPPPDESEQTESDSLAAERVEANRRSQRRHVWRLEGEYLRAIEVQLGIRDNRFVMIVSGELEEGVELVTGLKGPGEL